MKLSLFGRTAVALFATLILGLGMTGCGGGTIAYMWVLGQQYNQISAFKVDDYTGNLTQVPHEPFATNGTVPVDIKVKPGGRYVYVLNQGTGGAQGVHATSGNISVFSVGGDGTLTFQISYQSQGFNSKWMEFDATGSTLYVLDQYSPSGDGNGAITAFSADSSSGRLTLIQNTQSCGNATCPTYFEVGDTTTPNFMPSPFMMKSSGTCLFTANGNKIAPYAFNAGQLILQPTGVFSVGHKVSSITGNGSLLVVTDDAATGSGDTAPNSVTLYTIGAGCNLTVAQNGVTSLTQFGTANPEYAMIDATGKYLYVLNQANVGGGVTVPSSTIMAFIIQSGTNILQAIAGSPYGVGAQPVEIVEDPTSQYFYVSSGNGGTITGKLFQPTDGTLSNLTRGSTFSTSDNKSSNLAISGAID